SRVNRFDAKLKRTSNVLPKPDILISYRQTSPCPKVYLVQLLRLFCNNGWWTLGRVLAGTRFASDLPSA
ncbi:hypothetical protein NKI77_05420, partial [Mesorhizobium opportunistum]